MIATSSTIPYKLVTPNIKESCMETLIKQIKKILEIVEMKRLKLELGFRRGKAVVVAPVGFAGGNLHGKTYPWIFAETPASTG